jgi:hypothetical protein
MCRIAQTIARTPCGRAALPADALNDGRRVQVAETEAARRTSARDGVAQLVQDGSLHFNDHQVGV